MPCCPALVPLRLSRHMWFTSMEIICVPLCACMHVGLIVSRSTVVSAASESVPFHVCIVMAAFEIHERVRQVE
jgi:hypothetical protein